MHLGSLNILCFGEIGRKILPFAKEGRPFRGMDKMYIISFLLPKNKVSCTLWDEADTQPSIKHDGDLSTCITVKKKSYEVLRSGAVFMGFPLMGCFCKSTQ